jgi:ergothioneine biosynthesis protein EgtB
MCSKPAPGLGGAGARQDLEAFRMTAFPSSARADAPPSAHAESGRRSVLRERFAEVRAASVALAQPLSAEDQCVQSMPDASPTKWHLAHTSWFFEAVVLAAHDAGYRPFNPRFFHLFNSYYEALGPRHPRPQRGLLTRPSLDEVHAYRAHVDAGVLRFLSEGDAWEPAADLIELGLNHEQQHQELILTDILHALSCNPLLPAYQPHEAPALRLAAAPAMSRWIEMPGGVVGIGHDGDGFAFDNEGPRHSVLVAPYRIADRLVTCGEYAQFIADGGYSRPELWLSDGWAAVQGQGWRAPPYWLAPDDPRAPSGHWQVFGLGGVRPLDADAPVTQLSFYEACAYAEWAGARLPTEFEWEAAFNAPGITQMTGHAWQWTRSSYDPYPGFVPFKGAVGEYNGKFMVGQLVLRGGSAATPEGHTRPTYRNFFPPGARWQFSGLRLAKDAAC